VPVLAVGAMAATAPATTRPGAATAAGSGNAVTDPPQTNALAGPNPEKGGTMSSIHRLRSLALSLTLMFGALFAGAPPEPGVAAALPPGNTVAQWNKIAEDTVVAAGGYPSESFIYMAYASTAVYNAVVAIEGGYQPLNSTITAPAGASVDCAVVEAAYRTLGYYFAALPVLVADLDADYAEALSPSNLDGCTADGGAGTRVGLAAANELIYNRTTGPDPDGRLTPIGVSSPFPTLPPGPGVWRLTPPFAPPQVPWAGDVRPFVLPSPDQFLPDPPPSLHSEAWVEAFNEIKAYGAADSSVRTAEETAIAKFWSANTIRQYNRLAREIAGASPDMLQTARLTAMVNIVGADDLIATLHAKYHYLFWRPVRGCPVPCGTWVTIHGEF
jgi:hypothetical protein